MKSGWRNSMIPVAVIILTFSLAGCGGGSGSSNSTGPSGSPKIVGGKDIAPTVSEAAIPGGTLNPSSVPKYQTPMLIPPVMPKAGTIVQRGGKNIDYYEISVLPADPAGGPSGLGLRSRSE